MSDPGAVSAPATSSDTDGSAPKSDEALVRACTQLQAAVQQDPADPKLHRQLSEAQLRLGRLDASLASALRACELGPEDSLYKVWSSAVLLACQRAQEQAEGYRRAQKDAESAEHDRMARASAFDLQTLASLSEQVKIVPGASDTVLVWFAGLNEPFLNTRFLEGTGLNGLFLRDIYHDWYTGGLEGLPGGRAALVDWLRGFLDRLGLTKVVIGGQSSGGYAALRFAHDLQPSLCIAFAPQTGNRPGLAWGAPSVDNIPAVPLDQLDELYTSQPRDFPIVLHLARSESKHRDQFYWDDWGHAGPLMHLDNLTVVRHPSDEHAVSLYLHSHGMFYPTILADIYRVTGPNLGLKLVAATMSLDPEP